MRRFVCLWAAALFLALAPAARAEILEIKDEGFVNGTVTAEDDKTVTFKDAHGAVRKIPKASILMREEEKKVSLLRRIEDKTADVAKKVAEPMKGMKVPGISPGNEAPAAPAHYQPQTGHQADVDAATGMAVQAAEASRLAFNAQIEQQRKMRRMTQEEQGYKNAAAGPKPHFTSIDEDKK